MVIWKEPQQKHYVSHEIRRHHIVTRYELNNIKRIHENVKSIGDLSLHQAARKCPRILKSQSKNISQILTYFREMQIPGSSISKCLPILTLHHDTVIERMNSILSNPALTIFRNHSRFLYLVFAYDKLEERIELLHSMNFTCMSLSALITSIAQLQRRYANGCDLSNRQDMEAFLDYEFPTQGAAFMKELQKNPNWLHVPLQQISQSLHYLKQFFSVDVICNNIQIILYHKVELEKTWKFIQDQYENYEGHQFTSSQKLALCLYHLELKHNFSGHGILVSKTNRNEQICQSRNKI